ncbi:MAG: 30S ribosomal protein S20 [candidate division WOR-3 bacterium]
MPIKQSAKKYLRASRRRAAQNAKIKKTFKDAVKKLCKLATAGKIEEAKKMFPSVQKALDKAAKAGVITKNTAARKKSRLVKLLKKLQEKPVS